MQIKIDKGYKSIPGRLEFELPMFTVITGENGSGKTHLFETLNDNSNSQILINGKQLKSKSYVAFGALNPQVDQRCDPNQISQRIKQVWHEVQQAQIALNRNQRNMPIVAAPEQDAVLGKIRNQQYKEAVLSISNQSGIMPSQLTEDIIADRISMMDLSGNNLFNTQFALIFKSYHVKYIDNKLNKVYEEDGIVDAPKYLNDEKFKLRYGEAPWIFVNSILKRLCMPYEVNDPLGTKRDSTFDFKLIHKESKIEIDTNDLSTGEKTLMSLALAIYNSTGISDRAEIIILDEPDAPLHPSMSKLMLEIVEEEIVKKHGIPVILSTHSPTTIACTPGYSLYKMTSKQKQPEPCDLQDSIRILTYGIPNLRVSTERRRQVFVEHTYDVIYYESLFDIISRVSDFVTTPQFLPPHTLNGANCDSVLEITRKLRNLGNTQVYGLIDWDLKNKPEKQVVILGMSRRYAIENYLFEPHFLGLYLVYKKFSTPKELGFEECDSYLELTTKIINDNQALQILIDGVEDKISWESEECEVVESVLLDGRSVSIRSDILTLQGHKYEEMCKEAWPQLCSVRGNNDGDSALKKEIINTVINDFPKLVSKDLVDTFKELK